MFLCTKCGQQMINVIILLLYRGLIFFFIDQLIFIQLKIFKDDILLYFLY